MAGPHGKSRFSLVGNCRSVIRSGCTAVHPHRQGPECLSLHTLLAGGGVRGAGPARPGGWAAASHCRPELRSSANR